MNTGDQVVHFSIADRLALGEQAAARTAHHEHAGWRPAPDRPDPVSLLEAQNKTRDPDLVPVRHGRMIVSPFTFYRGTATVMAADLAATPTAGLEVQLCGDAHLSNFGAFASPRQLLFDLNDFYETLPGPFEYDVKRQPRVSSSPLVTTRFRNADTRTATLTVSVNTGCQWRSLRNFPSWISGTPGFRRTTSEHHLLSRGYRCVGPHTEQPTEAHRRHDLTIVATSRRGE